MEYVWFQNKLKTTKIYKLRGINMSNKKTKSKAKKSQAKKNTKKSSDTAFISAVILTFLSLIFSVFCYFPPSATGVIGDILHTRILLGLFSGTMYLIPIILIGLTVYIFKFKDLNRMLKKAALSFAELILCGALIQLFSSQDMMYSELYDNGMMLSGGGVLGGTLGLSLYKLFGTAASVIIVIFAMFFTLSILFKVSFVGIFKSLISGLKEEISDLSVPERLTESEKVTEPKLSSKKERQIKKKPKNASDLDFEIDDKSDTQQKTEKPKKTDSEQNDDAAVVSEEELQKRIERLIYENTDTPAEISAKSDTSSENTEKNDDDAGKISEKPTKKKETPERADPVTTEEKEKINKEIDSAIDVPVKEYEFPSINLLQRAKVPSADKRREMSETAKKLMDILKNFGVDAKLQQVTQGPTVTRYEIQPSTGVKLSKITGLADDIALNLAVPTVLVAPVPGKAAVGIEVPNASVNTVSVRELLESDEYKNGKSKLTVAFGKDIGGKVVVGDIAKMPHVLIAGSTGSGKSVCINTLIVSILYKAKPDEVKLIMVDPKVVELSVYNGIPHLLIPVVTDPKRAAGALNWAVGEMMRRYSLFAQTATRNLEGYNTLMEKQGGEKIPQIVIIIDELADLMMVAAKEVEEYICRLAQLARAAGIHLVIATQRPSVDVITGLIKANVPSRIAFAVSSQTDSRTILDKGGAEKLLGRGDMLYHPAGLSNAKRVQGAFVSDDEISAITEFLKANNDDSHYSEDLAEHIDNCANGEYGVTKDEDKDDGDELLPEAIDLALELGQISTAMIQRRLKVGYARAGRIIDQMEMRGLISGANGSKPREVYRNRILSSGNDSIIPEEAFNEEQE